MGCTTVQGSCKWVLRNVGGAHKWVGAADTTCYGLGLPEEKAEGVTCNLPCWLLIGTAYEKRQEKLQAATTACDRGMLQPL